MSTCMLLLLLRWPLIDCSIVTVGVSVSGVGAVVGVTVRASCARNEGSARSGGSDPRGAVTRS